MRRKHKDVDEDEDENQSLDQSDLIPDAGSDFDSDGEEEHNMIQDQVMETKNSTDEMTRHIALFILKSKEQNQLNQPVLDSILGNTADLLEQIYKVSKKTSYLVYKKMVLKYHRSMD